MKIAAYIDAHDQLVSLYEPGRFCVYQGSGNDWTRMQEIAFALGGSTSLATIKAALASAANQFDGCDVLLSGGVKGFLYAFLQEEFGVRIWKSQGALFEQLAAVEQRELERAERERLEPKSCAAAAGCASRGCGSKAARPAAMAPERHAAETVVMTPDDLGSGTFRIDLAAALGHDARLNSRQVLLPILQEAAFEKLEILCDHLPRWFEPKLRELNLTADCVPLASGRGVKAIVSHASRCG